MGQEKVEVTIHPDGRVDIHVVGVEGMDCLTVTDPLTKALGGQLISQELTNEAYLDVEDGQEDRLWH